MENQKEEILNEVKRLWDKYPQYRFGQVIVNFGFGQNNVFYLDDNALLERLKASN
jgi:hypothetical protein